MAKSIRILFIIFLHAFVVEAQIEGDKIFKNDQIITIELTFHQVSFFDSLEANYLTEDYMKADLVLTDSTGTYSYPEVGVRLKGNSSYNHPNNKKAFKIDFNEYVSGQKHDGIKKLNFSNNFKDPSMMREKVFFDVCKAAGVKAPRSNFANVYFNGTLWGFYTMVEQIDDQFLDWAILDDDGNLFKAGDNFGGSNTPADLVYYGSSPSDYTDRYELKTNEDENDVTDLIEFIDFINNSASSDFENELPQRMELNEFLRSVAFDNMFGNYDSYTGSARNYYLYHNMTTDKWEWVKWDGNEAFGSYPAGGGGGPGGGGGLDALTIDPDYHDNDRPLLENIFSSTSLYHAYLLEYCFLLENYFNSDFIDPIIDAHYALIKSSVYGDNNKMYTDADFDNNIVYDVTSGGGPGGGTIYGLKSFVSNRVTHLDGVLNCSEIVSIEKLDGIDEIEMFPNPAKDQFRVTGSLEAIQKVLVLNANGVQICEYNVKDSNLLQLDVKTWPTGMYFVLFQSKEGSILTRTLSVAK